MLAEVHTLYETNARSIADMLRQSADSIEANPEHMRAMVAVGLNKDGEIEIYGWGEVDDHKAIALLERGKFDLLVTMSATEEDG